MGTWKILMNILLRGWRTVSYTHLDVYKRQEYLFLGFLFAFFLSRYEFFPFNDYQHGGFYGQAIDKIIYWLHKALGVAEDAQQKIVIEKLIRFYKNGFVFI